MRHSSDLDKMYDEILKNSLLQERLKAASSPDKLISLVIEMGKERGYSIAEEEVKTAMELEASIGGDYRENGVPLVDGKVYAGCGCGGPGGDDDDDVRPVSEDDDDFAGEYSVVFIDDDPA